jgi:hypothetical protein
MTLPSLPEPLPLEAELLRRYEAVEGVRGAWNSR